MYWGRQRLTHKYSFQSEYFCSKSSFCSPLISIQYSFLLLFFTSNDEYEFSMQKKCSTHSLIPFFPHSLRPLNSCELWSNPHAQRLWLLIKIMIIAGAFALISQVVRGCCEWYLRWIRVSIISKNHYQLTQACDIIQIQFKSEIELIRNFHKLCVNDDRCWWRKKKLRDNFLENSAFH